MTWEKPGHAELAAILRKLEGEYPNPGSLMAYRERVDLVVDSILEAGFVKQQDAQLTADLHTGFQVTVSGNAKALDVLKGLLVPVSVVKSIRVFDNTTREYTTRLNYTALKALRKEES